jgi:hypothetical protein
MKWLRNNLRLVLMLGTMLLAMGMAWGDLNSRVETLSGQVAAKMDRDQVLRELDRMQRQLEKIDQRLDGVIIRQAIIADE